jgi:hypothetical protein
VKVSELTIRLLVTGRQTLFLDILSPDFTQNPASIFFNPVSLVTLFYVFLVVIFPSSYLDL